MGAFLASYGKPLGLGLGLLVVWVGSGLLANDPPAAAAERAGTPAPTSTAATTATEGTSSKKSSRPGKYSAGPVTNGGTVRVRCVLSRAFDVVEVPLNKDKGPSKCGHDTMKSERAVYDPETLALANAVVWIEGIERGKEFTGEMAQQDQQVQVDQKGCRYVPHVMLVRLGARLSIRNSDPVEHNIQGFFKSKLSQLFNVMSSSRSLIAAVEDTTLTKAGHYILGCSIHPWMSGYIWAVGHPYYGVTGLDGTVVLTDVPPGTYKVGGWHEGMGMTIETSGAEIKGYQFTEDRPFEPKPVTVTAGETADVVFTIEPR